ncbi:MAG TPA: choice-of-anchor J domain-containing protein [Flavobacterium sp.]|nr:choice-of-anchor J domain-containing protein [Flavobacterium sp.]
MKKITLLLFTFILSNAGFAQFSENFDSGTTLPSGWTVIDGGDEDNTWGVIDISDEIGVDPHSGTNAATIFYDAEVAHDDYLITPAITVVAGVNDYFSFWGRSLDIDYPEVIDVKLSTTGVAATDFTVTLQANVAPESGEDYYKFAYDLSAYVGQTIHIAFYSSTVNQDIFEVDDVASTALPSCFEPSAFTVGSETATTAELTWVSTGTSFEIEYGPAGFVQGTGTIVNATASPLVLTSLTPGTAYDAYIRTNCGGGDYSAYLDVQFGTLAANDTCATAVPLTVASTFEGGATVFTDAGATTDLDVVPSCQDLFYDNDVWFTVVVPADGNLTLETDQQVGSDNEDTIVAAFTGTCGALTEIGCNDDKDPDNDIYFSKLDLTGLTPGSTIYVAVWQYSLAIFGEPLLTGPFRLSAYNASLSTGNFNLNKLTYYPNPVTNFLNLSNDKDITDVTVTNMLGQQVMAKSINATNTQLDLSGLSQGTYMVRVNTTDATKVVKVVKQ